MKEKYIALLLEIVEEEGKLPFKSFKCFHKVPLKHVHWLSLLLSFLKYKSHFKVFFKYYSEKAFTSLFNENSREKQTNENTLLDWQDLLVINEIMQMKALYKLEPFIYAKVYQSSIDLLRLICVINEKANVK